MPKIVTTAAKGLVQSTGSGFKQLDFMSGYEGNLTGTVNAISIADGRNGEIGTPTDAQIADATINENALNTTAISGATGTTTVYLPGAYAGTHCALKFTANPTAGNNCKIVASHATYNSAGEAGRIAAGGTAAVFAAVRVSGEGSSAASLNHDMSNGSEKNLTIAFDGTNNAHAQNGTYHFYCIEDGQWAVAIFGPRKGSGSLLVIA